MTKENHQDRVLKLLQLYGHQSQSYNILRDDKTYFFSPSGIEGVIAYVVNANVALVAGDPICDPSDFPQFMFEFKQFCKSQKLFCCFQAVTDRCKSVLQKMGFGIIKIGEEPFFELDKLSWSGGKFSDLRKDTNSAKRHGLAVIEYFPAIDRRPDW
ncbi:MAG: DUF2156 domain-containing protein, partial [Planctomycetes bacterium]|nr:DUF2156 domain-containing protein [Planctomycetota bacterium]